MTNFLQPKPTHADLRQRTTTALRVAVALSLASACAMVLAETRAESDLQSLEVAFWSCDHAASTRGYGAAEGMACSVTYEELKQRKFDGSFEAFLAWWQEHKSVMHAALEQAEGSAASAQTEDSAALAEPLSTP